MSASIDRSPITSPVITLATYRRPDSLRALLVGLAAQEGAGSFRIVVVDNDAALSGAAVAKDFDCTYVTEPTPGIVAARNRGLDEVRDTDDAIVFIDDDEVPAKNWLQSLVAHANASGADVVSGPVVSDIPDHAPRWLRVGGYIQRPRRPSGDLLTFVATNNTLLRRSAWDAAGRIRFDQRFAVSGGSDTAFFLELARTTDRMQWCDDAVVVEEVPDARMTWKWNWRRGRRIGGVMARIQLRDASRMKVLLDAVPRVGFYSLKGAVNFPRKRVVRYVDFAGISYNVGRIEACFNRSYDEYARR